MYLTFKYILMKPYSLTDMFKTKVFLLNTYVSNTFRFQAIDTSKFYGEKTIKTHIKLNLECKAQSDGFWFITDSHVGDQSRM